MGLKVLYNRISEKLGRPQNQELRLNLNFLNNSGRKPSNRYTKDDQNDSIVDHNNSSIATTERGLIGLDRENVGISKESALTVNYAEIENIQRARQK